jgi:hypothetical protein
MDPIDLMSCRIINALANLCKTKSIDDLIPEDIMNLDFRLDLTGPDPTGRIDAMYAKFEKLSLPVLENRLLNTKMKMFRLSHELIRALQELYHSTMTMHVLNDAIEAKRKRDQCKFDNNIAKAHERIKARREKRKARGALRSESEDL